ALEGMFHRTDDFSCSPRTGKISWGLGPLTEGATGLMCSLSNCDDMIKLSRLLDNWDRAPEILGAWRETVAWRELTVRYMELGRPSFPFVIPLRKGGRIQTNSPAEVKVFWQIFIHQCYRLPNDCKIIVDAGANIGAFAIWAAR